MSQPTRFSFGPAAPTAEVVPQLKPYPWKSDFYRCRTWRVICGKTWSQQRCPTFLMYLHVFGDWPPEDRPIRFVQDDGIQSVAGDPLPLPSLFNMAPAEFWEELARDQESFFSHELPFRIDEQNRIQFIKGKRLENGKRKRDRLGMPVGRSPYRSDQLSIVRDAVRAAGGSVPAQFKTAFDGLLPRNQLTVSGDRYSPANLPIVCPRCGAVNHVAIPRKEVGASQ